MPHDHQWVTERVALGSAVTRVEHVRCLAEENITHVLDCRMSNPHPEIYDQCDIVHRQYGILDDSQSQPDAWFHQGAKFALDAMKNPSARVVVHCLLGVSRGPSMVYAILRLCDMSAEEAESRIKAARAMVRDIKYRADAERAVGTWLAERA